MRHRKAGLSVLCATFLAWALGAALAGPGAAQGPPPAAAEVPEGLRRLDRLSATYRPFLAPEDAERLGLDLIEVAPYLGQPDRAWRDGDATLRGEVRAHLERNREVLDKLCALFREPGFRLLEGTEPAMDSPVANVIFLKAATCDLALEARMAAEEGRWKDLYPRLHALVRVVVALGRDGILLSRFIAAEVERVCLAPLVRDLLRVGDPALRARVASRLEELDRDAASFGEVVRGEFACIARSTPYVRGFVSKSFDKRLGADGPGRAEADALLDAGLAGFRAKVEALGGKLVGLADRGDLTAMRQAQDEFAAEVKRVKLEEVVDELIERVESGAGVKEAWREVYAEQLGRTLVLLTLPDVARAAATDAVVRGERGLLRVLCALLDYHDDHGELPATLDAPGALGIELPAPPLSSMRLHLDLGASTLSWTPLEDLPVVEDLDAERRLRLDLREYREP